LIYPQSGSLISSERAGTHTGLSTQIIIMVQNFPIGAIQEFSINQNRSFKRIPEIGTDGVVEIHPKGAAKITLNVTRIVFDELRLTEAFARGFINLQAQRIPFDIQIIDRTSSMNELDAIIHVFHNCWFKNYAPSYQADNFVISEDATLVCEYITSSRQGQSVSVGGLRGLSYEYDTVERSTDVNGRRGRLDSAGLLTRT